MSDRDDRPLAGDGARQRALQEFVSPEALPEGARMEEAEAVLQKVLEREIPELRDSPPDVRTPARAQRTWWTGLWSPRGRLVFATMTLIVVGAWLTATWTRTPHEPVMRGAPGTSDAFAPAAHGFDGVRRLDWRPQPEALDYTVVFVDPDLHEIARVSGVKEAHLDLHAGSLPHGLESGRQVMWRVLAMRGHDELGRSNTTVLTLP